MYISQVSGEHLQDHWSSGLGVLCFLPHILIGLVSFVFSDLLQNPLIVPVKVLRGHTATNSVGIMDCVFHPSQPWIFSAGADGTIRLYT